MKAVDRDKMDPNLVEGPDPAFAPTVRDLCEATVTREALGRRMMAFHEDYDILLTPTMPVTAIEAGRDFPADSNMLNWFDWNPNTYPFNLTQQPAASMPCGLSDDGLPVGLQIVGPGIMTGRCSLSQSSAWGY